MSKHTPGPWVAICGPAHMHGNTRLLTASVHSEKTRAEMEGRGYHEDGSNVDNVIICSCGTFQDDVSVDELHANARLIAQAPRLLEALEVMVATFEQLAGDCQDKAQAEAEESAVSKAVAAIAKAKGE